MRDLTLSEDEAWVLYDMLEEWRQHPEFLEEDADPKHDAVMRKLVAYLNSAEQDKKVGSHA